MLHTVNNMCWWELWWGWNGDDLREVAIADVTHSLTGLVDASIQPTNERTNPRLLSAIMRCLLHLSVTTLQLYFRFLYFILFPRLPTTNSSNCTWIVMVACHSHHQQKISFYMSVNITVSDCCLWPLLSIIM